MWNQKNAKSYIFNENNENFYKDLDVSNRSKILSKSNSDRSKSLSSSLEVKKLLSSSSSKPLTLSRRQSPSETSMQSRKKSPFDRLYDNAYNKEAALIQNRNAAVSKELEECTFRPTVINYNERTGSVFEKLHYSDISEKEKLYQNQREHKEMIGCTFKPKINNNKNATTDNSFEKLYKDAEVQRQKIREKELMENDKDIIDCTFRPTLQTVNTSYSGNVYEKLYNNFQEIQKERKRKQLENLEKEVAEVQFVPKLITPKHDSGDMPVYARLYAEVEKRKEKAKKQTEEKERSKSATRIRKTDEPPRFEHLYALHKEKIQKQGLLQEKYLKDSGIIFKPNINKTSNSRNNSQIFPKSPIPYPMPKNPYSDISSHSSFS